LRHQHRQPQWGCCRPLAHLLLLLLLLLLLGTVLLL
jgi:hypothetical protein